MDDPHTFPLIMMLTPIKCFGILNHSRLSIRVLIFPPLLGILLGFLLFDFFLNLLLALGLVTLGFGVHLESTILQFINLCLHGDDSLLFSTQGSPNLLFNSNTIGSKGICHEHFIG